MTDTVAQAAPPWARTPWNEIDRGLYQGGLWYQTDGDVREVVVGYEFGLVVSLDRRWDSGPAAGIPELRAFIPDGELTGAEMAKVTGVVPKVVEALDAGTKVLVRCRAGLNRSGLVVALVLLQRGHTADEAIGLIRARRSPHALHNDMFVQYVREACDGRVS